MAAGAKRTRLGGGRASAARSGVSLGLKNVAREGGGRGDAALTVRSGENLGFGSAARGRGDGRPPARRMARVRGGASRSRTPAARVSMSERMFHVKHSAWVGLASSRVLRNVFRFERRVLFR